MRLGAGHKSLWLVVILLVAIIPISQIPNTTGDLINPYVVTNHGTIHINGNSQFNLTNGVISGIGSKNDPYIIENWSIDATNNHGIWIENTDAHFIIRNCHVFNGTNQSQKNNGIYFFNVTNGIIENCRLNNNNNGIYLTYSNNNFISNNKCNFNTGRKNKFLGGGIFLEFSNQNHIINNSCNSNLLNGITIWNSFYNHLMNNTCCFNYHDGIYLFKSNKNSLFYNTCNNNDNGIILSESINNHLYNNSMSSCGIFIIGDLIEHWNLHSIDTTNSVNKKPVFYWKNETNKEISINAGQIILANCSNVTISNQNLSNGSIGTILGFTHNCSIINNTCISNSNSGIYLFNSNFNYFEDNIIIDNYYGIYFKKSINNTILKNTCNSNFCGIEFYSSDNNTIINNTCQDNSHYGILARYSDNFTIEKNFITKGGNSGIRLYYCNNYKIINNSCIKFSNGIEIVWSNYINIENNTCILNGNGLMVASSHNNTIIVNNFSSCEISGICLQITSSYNLIKYNNCSNNRGWLNYGDGIHFQNSFNNTITNNTCNSNFRSGIYIWFSNDNIVSNNTCRSNVNNGIVCKNSQYNLIYNNYFSNLNNYLIQNSVNNKWNISKTSKRNIISGPFLGGNFWSNYNGSDTNGDGLGNTNLPYGPGDYLPLIDQISPKIIDKTFCTPTTGDLFTITSMAWDNNFVQNVYIEYYFDNGPHSNLSLNIISGDFNNGTYIRNITISSTAITMYYNLSVTDLNGNWNSTPTVSLDVSDNDKPLIIDHTSSPTTGENFLFNTTVTDNINVSDVYIHYNLNDGFKINITPNLSGQYYHANIAIPLNATILKYTINASDISSNWRNITEKTIPIIDNDKPSVTDFTSGVPITDDNFTFTAVASDNINVLYVYVNYWFDDKTPQNYSMTDQNSYYNSTIFIDLDAKKLHYIISAVDNSNNWAALSTKILDIMDNDKPEILDLSNIPTTGDDFTFQFQIIDNIELSELFLEYWFDDNAHSNITLPENQNYIIAIPNDAFILYGLVTAVDTSSNIKHLEITKLIVDNDLPILKDLTIDEPETGELFKITCSISENRLLKNATIEYWFDEDEHITTSMEMITSNYQSIIEVPNDASLLNYIITAQDAASNAIFINKTLSVKDVISPQLYDLTEGEPTTGGEYTIKASADDNIGIDSINLEYWFDNQEHNNVLLTKQIKIDIPSNSLVLHYILSAYDPSGNVMSKQVKVNVIDNDPPIIEDSTSTEPGTGSSFEFKAKISDNIEAVSSYLEYWFDDFGHMNISFSGSYSINIPSNRNKLYYTIYAIDGHNNVASIKRILNIKDLDKPIIEDNSPKIATTGDLFNVSVQVVENRQLSNVYIVYWFESEQLKEDMKLIEGIYFRSIKIPDGATEFTYIVYAEDSAGNIQSIRNDLDVIDNDKPIIKDQSTISGDLYKFSVNVLDNIKISKVSVKYTFNHVETQTITLQLEKNRYESTIKITENTQSIRYMIQAEDVSGNLAETKYKEIELDDNLNPEETTPSKATDSDMVWLATILNIILVLVFIILLISYFYYGKKSKK